MIVIQEHACSLPVDDRDDDVAMAAVQSAPAGRRGGVSAEVYREEDAACYVKKVELAHITEHSHWCYYCTDSLR